jgi:hypothetical protein
VGGEIPDADAPRSSKSTKIGQAEARTDKLLAARWKTHLGTLADSIPADYEAAENLERSRNFKRHYENVLLFCSALRILGCRTISAAEAIRGTDMLSQAFQEWALMNVHLTPYFHLATHALTAFLRFGPSYGWHIYPYERHNGTLGKYNHNGHAGGELEATLMRSWWRGQLLLDLVCV